VVGQSDCTGPARSARGRRLRARTLGPLAALLKDSGAPLIVRRPPAWRAALTLLGVIVSLVGLYIIYELGRYNAGYDRQAAAQQRTELEVQIEHLEKENRQLRTQLAELDTIRAGREHEQSELARSLGELQAQVARQSQELAFYRGVVAQGAATLGVKIEQLRITAGTRPSSYIVHMSLVRSERADSEAAGTVQLSLDGVAAGMAKTLDLASLTAGRQRELRYSFRYVENFDQELNVPATFKPERLAVEVQSSHHGVAPLAQTFLWSVEASP